MSTQTIQKGTGTPPDDKKDDDQQEYVILVDEHDKPIGREEKVRCHMPEGKLHRAFTALLFEKDTQNLILAKRAGQKMLWPGYWDGTFASHPRVSETYVSSCERRMPEELGIGTEFSYMHKFEYHIPYKDIGSENEVCGTLVGVINDASDIIQVKGEIDSIKTVSAKTLASQVAANPHDYCPWMLVALYLLDKSDAATLKAYADNLGSWMTQDMRNILHDSISKHMPANAWRLIMQ